MHNPPWNREELILLMDLYARHGALSSQHAEVIELSKLLNRLAGRAPTPTFRNPTGISMKLANLLALDPDYPGVGLSAASRGDQAIWDEFTDHRDQLSHEAAAIRARILEAG